jgi:ABC-type branched-subunit amino acid transport system permease subunit
MSQQVVRFSVHQTSKVAGILYAIGGALFIPIGLLMNIVNPGQGFSFGVLLAFPILYGVSSYLGVAIGCLLYNLVSDWVGGIEFTVEERPDAPGVGPDSRSYAR